MATETRNSMLVRLLNGQEESHKLLIQDSFQVSGVHLLKWSLSKLTQSYNTVHVVLTDAHQRRWLKSLPFMINSNVFCKYTGKDPSLQDFLIFDPNKPIPPQDSDHSNLLLIDNLSTLMLSYSCPEICFLLQKLGFIYNKVICLLHYDLHDDGVISSLNHVVTTIVRLSPSSKRQGSSSTADGAVCDITHKRKSGSIIRKNEIYKFTENYDLDILVKEANKNGELLDEPSIDPGANLTFDLSLTKQERESKSRVVLPYTKKIKSGSIMYEPDENDDLDDSDPDDDLNI